VNLLNAALSVGGVAIYIDKNVDFLTILVEKAQL
jgi:hypothetical protein